VADSSLRILGFLPSPSSTWRAALLPFVSAVLMRLALR